MIAQNLAICIPDNGCDKNCPYCVSKITGKMHNSNPKLMSSNVKKVRTLAKVAQVYTVLLTGKGEPFLNDTMISFFIEEFSDFSVEIQTNGIKLARDCRGRVNRLETLQKWGLNVIAVSVDNFLDIDSNLFRAIHDAGMVSRITFNVTNKLHMHNASYNDLTFHNLLGICKSNHIDQMTLRNVVIPNNTKETKESIWIKENVDSSMYRKLESQMIEACDKSGFLLRQLPYGASVYDYEGIAVSYSRYCVQDSNKGDDIRSLIFQENGHCYTSWASKASILF